MSLSSIKQFATIYLTAAISIGTMTNWMARKQIKDDIQLFVNDPMETLILRKYAKYNIRSLWDLQHKPNVQRQYVHDRTVQAAGLFLMWPIL